MLAHPDNLLIDGQVYKVATKPVTTNLELLLLGNQQRKATTLFFEDFFIEFTAHTRKPLLGERTLLFTATKSTGNRPADPAGILAAIQTIGRELCRGRTLPQFMYFFAA